MTVVHGVAPPHENLLAFVADLIVDTTAPSNFTLTNPDVISATVAENGQNMVRGAKHLVEDLGQNSGMVQPAGPQTFEVGRNLAITPGKVVFGNSLIELIQYTPTTDTVHPEPILIVPAWIMKYYILDLSAQNSLVAFLVAQGYTVFIVSWNNPDAGDRNLDMEDYRHLRIMQAMDAAQAITQATRHRGRSRCTVAIKLHFFADADVTFVLTSGGRNAGIVYEPGHRYCHFRIADTPSDAAFRDAAQ